jgi:hypothetical protein
VTGATILTGVLSRLFIGDKSLRIDEAWAVYLA